MTRLMRLALTLLLAGMVTAVAAQAPRPVPRAESKVQPKFAVLAETKLLMKGLADANYRGLETLLKQKPTDAETWEFVRGQALLIAETGNLLLLRPPRSGGRDAWYRRAMDLRTAAGRLARDAGVSDYTRCRADLQVLANVCNRCHETFRVDVRVGPGDRRAPQRGEEP